MAYSPGGIGGQALEADAGSDSAVAAKIREYYEKRYGIHKPKIVQFGRWLNQISPVGLEIKDDGSLGHFGFKAPSLGDSMEQNRPVIDLIRERLPLTLLLNLVSIPIVYILGVATGIQAAKKRGGIFDNVSNATQLAMWSVPTIWAGVMLIGLLASRQYLKLFPTSGLYEVDAAHMAFLPHMVNHVFVRGYLLDVIWHLILPVICLSYGSSAFLTKLTRGSMLENLGADYTRTARAKGLPENVILYRHVLRNSTLALITVAAGILPSMLGGSIVVEWIFSIPGMGQLGVHAVQFRDREVVLAVTLIGGFVSLASQVLRDILYALADPRVSYE
jgi:peptide/nickel transport system permease protein